MLRQTGCDGVMIARGCLGNPFIFAQARALLEGREARRADDPASGSPWRCGTWGCSRTRSARQRPAAT